MQPSDFYLPDEAALGGGDIRITWLGTAGFSIEFEGHVLLIDPYLTRASLASCLFSPLRSDPALVRRITPRADAILLSHTHFDHALDTPEIARQTGARVFGSESALHLCRAEGIPESQLESVQLRAGGPPHQAEVGPFRLRFWPSAHSAFLLGRVPFPGDIADCSDLPLHAKHYRCGAVFGAEIEVAGKRLFHVGSAELVEQGWRVGEIDLALACVAGWTTTERYPERLLAALSPGAVLLHHWDNFLRDIDAEARAFPAMRTEALVDRLRKGSREPRIGALPIFGTVRL